ncbi:MAG: hypothetical protein ACE5GW_01375 [Planctomycetota bacterium]
MAKTATRESPTERPAGSPEAAAAAATPARRRVDRGFVAAAVVYVGFLAAMWGAHMLVTKPRLKITPYDVVARPGEEVELAVKVERDLPGRFNPDREGIAMLLGLLAPGSPALKAVTDREGIARARLAAPETAGTHRFRAGPEEAGRYTIKSGRMPPRLAVIDGSKPILVCDIDDTVTAGGGWKLLFAHGDPRPMPGSPEVLRGLAKRFQLLFLTARDDTFLNETRDWLIARGFPDAAVIGRDWSLRTLEGAGEFKEKTLKAWTQRFGAVAWGIGNSKGDCRAYREAGIPHITLERSRCPEEGAVPCRPARDWTEVAAHLRGG